MKENNKSKYDHEKYLEEERRKNKKHAVRLRDRSLTSFEVVNLFEDVFEPDQKEIISTIIKILGVYMVLETNQLFQIYERMTKKKLKLKYIKIAVKYNLIAEYQYNSTVDGEKDLFFYSTKLSGRTFLINIGFKYNGLLLDTTIDLKQRILTLNEFLIENRYLMSNRHTLSHLDGIYEVGDSKGGKVVCYFGEISTERNAVSYMVNYANRFKGPDDIPITREEVLEKYRFEQVITDKKYYFGDLTIATPYSYIYMDEFEGKYED